MNAGLPRKSRFGLSNKAKKALVKRLAASRASKQNRSEAVDTADTLSVQCDELNIDLGDANPDQLALSNNNCDLSKEDVCEKQEMISISCDDRPVFTKAEFYRKLRDKACSFLIDEVAKQNIKRLSLSKARQIIKKYYNIYDAKKAHTYYKQHAKMIRNLVRERKQYDLADIKEVPEEEQQGEEPFKIKWIGTRIMPSNRTMNKLRKMVIEQYTGVRLTGRHHRILNRVQNAKRHPDVQMASKIAYQMYPDEPARAAEIIRCKRYIKKKHKFVQVRPSRWGYRRRMQEILAAAFEEERRHFNSLPPLPECPPELVLPRINI